MEYTSANKNIWFPGTDYSLFKDFSDPNTVKFWKIEIEKCIHGFHLGKVFISGWLYWHTTYWPIELDTEIAGRSLKTIGIPKLRDVEWIVADELMTAEKLQKGIILMGSRGLGKSFILASIIGYFYTFFSNVETTISCGNDDDNKALTLKTELGLKNLPDAFIKARLSDNWGEAIVAGWKDAAGNRKGSNSRIMIRNFKNGRNSMACNGLRPKAHVIDEIGKIEHLIKCYTDSIPCWFNDYGQFSIPIFSGTGGDMEKGKESAKMFREPDAYNLVSHDNIYEGTQEKIGLFIPVTKARNEYKYLISMSDFLGIDNPATDHIMILKSDEQKCLDEFVKPRRTRAAKASDATALTKEKAYYPLTPTEAFYKVSANHFPIEPLKKQKEFLNNSKIKGRAVRLFKGLDGKVNFNYVDEKPITNWPHKEGDNLDAPVIILEPPTQGISDLYCAGADPYAQDGSESSTSLGALYIYKRRASVNDPFADSIVAYYVARPETLKKFHENCEMLLEYYNATCMVENEVRTFIQYFQQKNKDHLLADGLDLLKRISPNSKVSRPKGLPATARVISHCMNLTIDYAKEEIPTGREDHEGNMIKALGATRILDPMLLEEMINYYPGANVDRIVAFRHALAYANELDKYSTPTEAENAPEPYRPRVRSPFGTTYVQERNNFSFAKNNTDTATKPRRRNPFGSYP